jgi:hypothetical protein
MKRSIAGSAAALVVYGSLSLGLAAGPAQADPAPGCTSYACWCPGQPLPGGVAGDWDTTACHDWHYSWHDDPQAPRDQVEQGPMDCSNGPGFMPPCRG